MIFFEKTFLASYEKNLIQCLFQDYIKHASKKKCLKKFQKHYEFKDIAA